MRLPDDFIKTYQQLLAADFSAFQKSLAQEPVSAYRLNPLKESQDVFEDAISHTPWGYYGKISGKSIAHATGLVYSQEPAAQVVGDVAAPQKGMAVLDLAAAPGGKSTHLLSYLGNTGVLVSNEIDTKRSKVLVENLERFGARNYVVTNTSAEQLAKVFSAYFDLIVLDAPCSGEGMFRKDDRAIAQWHKDYPAQMASCQKTILAAAISMLAPGGQLVYSTCTWSVAENEDVVTWLLQTYPFVLENIKKQGGMVAGINMPEVVRCYPHRFKGEGQFVAKLRDTRSDTTIQKKGSSKKKGRLSSEQKQLWQAFSQEHLKGELTGRLELFGRDLYLLPDCLPDLSGLKIARNGLHLGQFKTKRFEPAFALGVALKPSEVTKTIPLSQTDFEQYVAGASLRLPKTYEKGWYQLVVGGNGFGFAKVVGSTLKNHYPKGLRFQC